MADGTSVSPPTPFDGDVAQVSNRPVSAVTLPELQAMAHLSQKADHHVAQLGLAASSASSSHSDDQDGEIQSPLRKTDKRSRVHPGKSLKSWKEAKITSTCILSHGHIVISALLTVAATSNTKSLHSLNSLLVIARSSYPQIYRRWKVPHVSNTWFR